MLERKVHRFVTKTFRFFRMAKKVCYKFLEIAISLALFAITYSEKLNPKVVKKHPILFAIHDLIITAGFLFGFFCFLMACGDNYEQFGFAEIIRSLCWAAAGGGIIFLIASANDAWNN